MSSRKKSWLPRRGYRWYQYEYLFNSLSFVKMALVLFFCISLLFLVVVFSYRKITGKLYSNSVDFCFNCVMSFLSGNILATVICEAFSKKHGGVSCIDIVYFVVYFIIFLQVVVPEFSITKLIEHYILN